MLPGRTSAGTTSGMTSTATAGTVTASAPGTRQPRKRYHIRMPSEARQAELAAKGIPIDYPLLSTRLTGIGVAITLVSAILPVQTVREDGTTRYLYYWWSTSSSRSIDSSLQMMIGLAIIQCLIIMMLKAYRVRVIPVLWASFYAFYTLFLTSYADPYTFMSTRHVSVSPYITVLSSIVILVGCCLRR